MYNIIDAKSKNYNNKKNVNCTSAIGGSNISVYKQLLHYIIKKKQL